MRNANAQRISQRRSAIGSEAWPGGVKQRWLLIGLLAAGCSHGETGQTSSPPPKGEPGATVEIPQQTATLGFVRSTIRRSVEVAEFTIARHPVSTGQYAACVAGDTCDPTPETGCTTASRQKKWDPSDVAGDTALTCVTVEGARQYCAHVGGRLPTLAEWLVAARGTSVRRYPWGEAAPSCEQHGLVRFHEDQPCERKLRDFQRVALHQAGASVHGVQDVLLTGAELLERDPEAFLPACRANEWPSSDEPADACAVYGWTAGEIKSVRRIRARSEDEQAGHQPKRMAIGFRCAW